MSTPADQTMALDAQVRCCICLDVYVDPASIPCGHNFCLDCIEGYWDSKDTPVCPLCKDTFTSRPKLKVNTELAAIVDFLKKLMRAESTAVETQHEAVLEAPCDVCRGKKRAKPCSACHGMNAALLEKERRRLKARTRETKTNIQEMIVGRRTKMEEILCSVEVSKANTEKEVQRSAEISSVLIKAIQRQRASLVQDLETKQREAETRARQLLAELQEEIHQLQAKDAELQLLATNQSPADILQLTQSLSELPPSREWSDVPVHSDLSLGTVRKAFSQLVEVCQDLTDNLSAEEMNRMSQHAVNITLDPQTASGWLLVSSDGKQVSCQKTRAALTNIPQRFDSCVCVLGKQRFTSGRNYWVVEVGDKSDWDLGVARESINRKGSITVRPDKGFWAICRRKGGNLSACASPYVNIDLQKTPRKVGVFLDYEDGSVSFFDAETKTHIHTFGDFTFTEPLYPYFNPCVQNNGRNVAPLVICPLEIN